MQRPLVSIITPSFNHGRFIRDTIESVLSQDYPHIEYFVIDGDSTDDTSDIVRSYGDRLTFVCEPDRGQSDAINKGMRIARGEIVYWINSDDIVMPGAVSRAVEEFERDPDLGFVYGEGVLLNEDGSPKGRFPWTEQFNLWRLIHFGDYIMQQTVFFKRAAFVDAGMLDESLYWAMDWDILIRIAKRHVVKYIPHELGAIREYGSTKTATGGWKRYRELVSVMRRHGALRYPPAYFNYATETLMRADRTAAEAFLFKTAWRFLGRYNRWRERRAALSCI